MRISFCDKLTEEEWNRVHFTEVLCAPTLAKGGKGGFSGDNHAGYIIAAKSGYVMCVTGTGKTVEEAKRKAYSLTDKIVIPRMFYRHDIGEKFIERDQMLLKKWGYL